VYDSGLSLVSVKRLTPLLLFLVVLTAGCGQSDLERTYEVAKRLTDKGSLSDTQYVRHLETSEELLDQIAGITIKASQRRLYVLQQLVNHYENLKMWPKAVEVAKKLSELQPGNIEWYLHLGRFHSNMIASDRSHIEQAERAFRTALEIDPNSIQAHFGLGLLYGFHTDDLNRARQHLEKASYEIPVTVKNRPDVVDARFALGKLEYQEGNLDRARDVFRSILQLESISAQSRFQAHRNLGDVFMSMGVTEMAKQQYHEAYEIQPYNSAIRSKLRNLGVTVEDRYNRFE
jgi:lipopolysaccharide biosynthesis regulator YciM